MLYCIFLLIINLKLVQSYLFNNPNKFEFNELKYRKYIPDKIPSTDLKRITKEQATDITKSWISINNKLKNNKYYDLLYNQEIHKEFYHNIDKLNIFNKYIEDYHNDKNVYLSWTPMSTKKKRHDLFIVNSLLDIDNQILIINNIIRTPEWNPTQISSNHFKNALIDYTNTKFSGIDIDFNHLYESDLKCKLSWATWELNCIK